MSALALGLLPNKSGTRIKSHGFEGQKEKWGVEVLGCLRGKTVPSDIAIVFQQ